MGGVRVDVPGASTWLRPGTPLPELQAATDAWAELQGSSGEAPPPLRTTLVPLLHRYCVLE